MRHPTLTFATSRLITWLIPILLCLGLASCGGGNSGAKRVVWNPGVLQVTVLQGSSQLSSIQLTVSKRVDDASLFVVPEIAGLLTVSLLGQTVLNPGETISVPMEFSVPATTAPGLYEGTVQVLSGTRTVPATLKVQIQVVQGSSDQVVNQVTDPSPDRIGRTSNGQFLVRDELVVALDRNIADPQTRIRDVAGQSGAVIIGSIPELLIYQLRIVGADVSSLPAYAASIRALAGVESVSRHFLSYPSAFPNDTISSDWSTVTAGGLNRHLEFINAPAAWDVTTGDASIRVAVIDVPIDDGHPDLPGIRSDAPRVVFNTRTANNNTNFAVSHGTIVAGTICARGNNGFGVTGVSWRCTLDHYSVAVSYVDILTNLLKPRVWCDENGWSLCKPLVSAVKVAKGMSSAVANGARIVNMSLQLVENNCLPKCTEDPSEAVKENNAVLEKAIQR